MRKTDKYIYFWGNADIYSQWHPSKFKCLKTGIIFTHAEQYMMYNKAMVFKDTQTAEKILKATNPKLQKELGREVKNFDAVKWDSVKYDIVQNTCYLKFTQNPDMLAELLKTGDRTLVEASPYDKIWGIGMKENDYGVEDEKNWQGENLLGYALTDTRNFLMDLLYNKENIFNII